MKRCNSKTNDPILPGFKHIRDVIHDPPLSTNLRKIRSKLNELGLWKIKTGFFSNRKSKVNDPIWPVFELIRDFIHASNPSPLICKCQEDLIKTE